MKKIFAFIIASFLAISCVGMAYSQESVSSGIKKWLSDKADGIKRISEKKKITLTPGEKNKNSERKNSKSQEENAVQENIDETGIAKLLYMGHGSLRITTSEGKIIYIDPFAGDEKMYSPSADLILLTHKHFDHVQTDKIKNRNEDCQTITWKEALKDGRHQSFDLGYAKIEAVEAGYNKNHDVKECVGYIITLSDGKSVYVSGDTSTTKQMPQLAEKNIDYAFFCADGTYNMDLDEAAECARLVKAKHNIPYHIISKQGVFFDRSRAEQFNAPDRLIIDEGEEIEIK